MGYLKGEATFVVFHQPTAIGKMVKRKVGQFGWNVNWHGRGGSRNIIEVEFGLPSPVKDMC